MKTIYILVEENCYYDHRYAQRVAFESKEVLDKFIAELEKQVTILDRKYKKTNEFQERFEHGGIEFCSDSKFSYTTMGLI